MRRTLLHCIGAGLLLAACGPQPELAPPLTQELSTEAEPETLPVVGGDPSAVCGFPMTAKIPGCTASLLTPTILVTAKHCGPKAGTTVQFGEKPPFMFSVRATKCVSATNSDAAYCVLPDDPRLKMVPTVPALHGCEYDKFMKVGARVMGVGFGQTQGTGPARVKNEVEVPVARVRDPFIDVGDSEHDLCFGDSGGGAYIHLVEGDKDWGWRLIGTVTGTARGVNGPCGGTDYTTILRHIKLIEDNEKIDVTPCTDATGAWAPGPECQGFLTDIQTGGGTWPACSSGPRTVLAIDSCGKGPAPLTDAGPPPVVADAGAPDAGPVVPPPRTPDAAVTPPPAEPTPGAGGATPPPATPPAAPGSKDRDAGAAAPATPVAPDVVKGGCQYGGGGSAGGGASAILLGLLSLVLGRRRRR